MLKKYPKEQFPNFNSPLEEWLDFENYHGHKNWDSFLDELKMVLGNWDNCITYEMYCKWFDIYYSPLYQVLKEEHDQKRS